MTADDRFSRTLSSWLHDEAEHRVPEHLAEVLVQTAATRQRPWWSSPERWLPMDLTTRARMVAPINLGRVLAVAALIVALLGLAIWFAGSRSQHLPAPFGPAANGEIVSSNVGDLYVSSADATETRLLVGGDTTDLRPLHTRDGTRFVFLRNVGYDASLLMLANADGSNIKPILDAPLVNPNAYDWSPTDDRLAVVHVRGDHATLSIVDVATPGRIRDLALPDGLTPDFNVQWRPPDGRELIFTASDATGKAAGLYTIRPDGSGFRQILPAPPIETYYSLLLAPDGRSASYWTPDPGSTVDVKHVHVHFVDLDTGADRLMRFDPTDTDELDFTYSPDGTSGYVTRQDSAAQDPTTNRVMLVRLDGSGPPRPVGPTFVWGTDHDVGFSPDGTSVIFHFNGQSTTFIDVATGVERTANDRIGQMNTWQRLAP